MHTVADARPSRQIVRITLGLLKSWTTIIPPRRAALKTKERDSFTVCSTDGQATRTEGQVVAAALEREVVEVVGRINTTIFYLLMISLTNYHHSPINNKSPTDGRP